jgi:hypothetical protein
MDSEEDYGDEMMSRPGMSNMMPNTNTDSIEDFETLDLEIELSEEEENDDPGVD